MEVIEKTLKDYGIDWILAERNDGSKQEFIDLINEIELAVEKVL